MLIGELKNVPFFYDSSVFDEMNERNINNASFDNVKPYIGEEGHLCFVGYVEAIGGSDQASLRCDAVEKNVIYGWKTA